jgi:hypothetical protein
MTGTQVMAWRKGRLARVLTLPRSYGGAMRTADGRGPHTKSTGSAAVRLSGALSWVEPHSKRLPLDRLTVRPDVLEVRSLFGRTQQSWGRSEIRRVAWVPRRWVLLRPGIKVTFRSNPTSRPPLFFRPWRIRHLKNALATAEWQVHAGDSD